MTPERLRHIRDQQVQRKLARAKRVQVNPDPLIYELDDALAEVDRLNRWKEEAIPVMLGLQDLGRALGLPLGENITGPAAVEAATRLRAQVAAVESVLEEGDHGLLCDSHYGNHCTCWNHKIAIITGYGYE